MADAPKPRTYEYNKEYYKKYIGKFTEIHLRLTPEQKAAWKDAAASAGESLNTFIIDAVEAKISAPDP